MSIRKNDHLGIAVHDLRAATALYETLCGAPATHTEEVEEQRVRVSFFEVGESHIELLEATDPSSPIAKFLEKNPRGGLHHICVEVSDIEATLAAYKAQGVRLIDEAPRRGAHNKRVAFVHPAATGGVLLELSEAAPAPPRAPEGAR